jgi:hypothetical protein
MQDLAVQVSQPSTPVTRSSARIGALDWTKGALVLCMVVYHSINYSAFRPWAFKLLAFLPFSFILIAGFLVGQVYAVKYDLATIRPYARLATRGVKLLALFIVLNVAYCVALERNIVEGLWEFSERSRTIFLSGNGREGVFEVLLPISYFLLLAPALLWLYSRWRGRAVATAAAILFLLCAGLDLNGISCKNLCLFSGGVIGMGLGFLPIRLIDNFARQFPLVLAIYIGYRVCDWFVGENYSMQVLGALATLGLIYGITSHLDCESWLGRQMTLFGNYSLMGYLVQIPLIQLFVLLSGGKPNHWLGVVAVIIGTSVVLFLVIYGIDELRRRSKVCDRMYKAVLA